jgi:hypothetical protein
MPRSWQRFRVYLKGEPDVIVQTKARDWADVRMEPGADVAAMNMTFQVVWAACKREGIAVPLDYVGFLEALDGMPDALDEESTDLLNPTGETRSGDSP